MMWIQIQQRKRERELSLHRVNSRVKIREEIEGERREEIERRRERGKKWKDGKERKKFHSPTIGMMIFD